MESQVLTIELRQDRMRVWGIRSGLSVLDQGLTSGAGFLVNLWLARSLPAEAYGAFAVAFATLLFLSGFHSSMLLEPMSVMGPARYSGAMPQYFVAQLKLHAVLATGLSAVLLLSAIGMARITPHPELPAAIAGSALALPFLLLLWLVRRMCYVTHRPSMAVGGSLGYLVLILIGMFALRSGGWLGAFSVFLLMGGASMPSAFLMLRRLGVLTNTARNDCPLKRVLRENWNYGRWLVAGTVLFSAASQTQTYIAAAVIGLSAAGILRAMQIPSLLMTQVITAVGLLVLPAMSFEYAHQRVTRFKQKALMTTLVLTAISLTYLVILAGFAGPIEHILYGGRFSASAWLIPVFGLIPVFTGFAMGFSMAVRASQRPHFDLVANGVSGPVGLVTALLFIRWWGLGGAALSMVAGFAAYATVFFYSFRSVARQLSDQNAAVCC